MALAWCFCVAYRLAAEIPCIAAGDASMTAAIAPAEKGLNGGINVSH